MTFAVILLPVLAATLAGLFFLWPSADEVPERQPVIADGAVLLTVTVTGVPDPVTDASPIITDGGVVAAIQPPGGGIVLEPGDRLHAVYIPDLASEPAPYVFLDFDRRAPIGVLAVAYVLVVLLVARWRGLASLGGLAVGFVVVLGFTIPALLAGRSPVLVALVSAVLVMFATLYLAHGFNTRTSTAFLGTLAGLILTAVIGSWAVGSTHLGHVDDTAPLLLSYADIGDLSGIALCGLLLAGMGILNDVTITQASAVWELRAAAPQASRRELFVRAMRIGRDHIASTVYTMAFAYVGAALPLIMLVWLTEQGPIMAVTVGEVAEEVIRTLVGSIGLILAIPATTAIGALAVPHAERVSAQS